MNETQSRPTIAEILAAADIPGGVDLDDAADVAEALLADGQGGEGVEYIVDGHAGEIAFTRTLGCWVLRHGVGVGRDWDWTFTPCATRAEAEAAYIETIQATHARGVTWEPDYCPIWDRVAATW